MFKSFLPESEILQRYIAYYYVDGSENPNYKNSYLFYPHINTTLSFYKNASFTTQNNIGTVSHNPKNKYVKLVAQQTEPIKAVQIGKTNKLAIVLKPLGLNHFIKENYSQIVPDQTQFFSPQNNNEWDDLLDKLFSTDSIQEKTQILDNFFLRQYNGYENDVLEKSIELLSDIDCDFSIDEIAETLNISRKTLLRYFKSELRMTPELFRTIVRFRYTVNKKAIKNSPQPFTNIAHEANFFDQSYFIKCFKRFTGVTPRQFFKQGTRIGTEDTFWTFNPK